MPTTDFSRGGLYFFGTSNMEWAFTIWDIPDGLRWQLHDYATGGAAHQTVLRLVRYAGDKGMFAAVDRSSVVIGVSYHLGTTETPTSYFPALVRRQGLYEIAPDDRLVEAPVNPIECWFLTEKARGTGLLWGLSRLANNWVQASLGRSHQPPPDPARYRREWRAFMGPNWQENTDREIGRLRQTIALLQSHHVPVKIILLPQGTWMNGLPYPPYYDARMRALAAAAGTPLLDWSRALPDADFIDSNHLTVAGQTKFRAMMLREEAGRLRRTEGSDATR